MKGEVMYVGDIEQQTHRMWENVEKLLEEGGMTMDNAAQIIVYLRDGTDYETVRRLFQEKYPDIPHVPGEISGHPHRLHHGARLPPHLAHRDGMYGHPACCKR